jgi:DNA helicase-2/ATP-dependent DNA helicase PcrA
MFKPSKYQLGIFEWVNSNIGSGKHLVVEAVAGSGKTTTAIEMLKLIPSNKDVIFCAFNKHIQVELSNRLPSNAIAMTYHSLGLSICKDNFGKSLKVDADKTNGLLQSILDKYSYGYLYPAIRRLSSLCKSSLLEPTYENITDLCYQHNIEVNGDIDIIIDAINQLLYKSKILTHVVDFDDMCYLPSALKLPAKHHDVIIVDELQDTNKSQIELALMSITNTGSIIGLGDRNQSIYGFRGADVNAIPSLIDRLNADTLPLSITYRNPNQVVKLVNEKFPDIKFEGRPDNIDGVYQEIKAQDFVDKVSAGDMILCRTNAPLVEYCFMLIRNGIKAIIKGRDIGAGLNALIKKYKKVTSVLVDLLYQLSEYRDLECTKLLASGKTGQAITLGDKINTIIALSDGCASIEEVERRIESIFSDDTAEVVLSSIHKAKGLESQRVFIIHPELLPHPLAKQSWEQRQEQNMIYVAYTRSLNELYIVEG